MGVHLFFLVIFLFIVWMVAGWFLDWLWSPFNWFGDRASDAGSTVGGWWDSATSWFGGGDEADVAAPAPVEPTPAPVVEAPSAEGTDEQPGRICRWTGRF